MSLSTVKSSNSTGPDYREYKLSMRDRQRESLKGAVLSATVAYTFYHSLSVFLILLPINILIFPVVMKPRLKEKRQWELRLQFKEAIWILSGYLSAGMSVENAFEMTLPELGRLYGEDAMIVNEFRTIVREAKLNKAMEPLLLGFAERSGLEEIRSFAEVFVIAKRSGGSLKEIIERTGKIIRDETEVREEIRNLTAAKRYEQSIMNFLPFGIIIYINVSSGGFMNIMYETLSGKLVMSLCLGLMLFSYYLSQRILNIRL